MPKSKAKIGAPPKYPWDKWLKPGTTRLLVRGKDFTCSIRSMIVYLYQRATKEGRSVTVEEAGYNKLNLEVHKQ
jgi:hypothetical protein